MKTLILAAISCSLMFVAAAAVFAFIGNAVGQQPCTPPPAGLVSWWPGNGNANDIIGGNNGVLRNGATFASGLVDQAFSFDGVDDFVAVPSSTDFDIQRVTLDAWVRPNPGYGQEFAGHIGIIGRWGGGGLGKATWMLSLNASGHVIFWTHDGVTTTSLVSLRTIPVNAFSHIAATLEGSTARIYINGAPNVVGTVLVPQPTSFFAVNIGIGGQPQDPQAPLSSHFSGIIDEVDVYNRALSPAEIQAIFLAGSAGKCRPIPRPITVTVNTNPAGLSYAVDGTTYTVAHSFSWLAGSTHMLRTTSPQSSGGHQYIWQRWSDNGAISHTIAPTTPTAYTAIFRRQ
jgi:Concanavalin A-like lectin/glucanases superfamily